MVAISNYRFPTILRQNKVSPDVLASRAGILPTSATTLNWTPPIKRLRTFSKLSTTPVLTHLDRNHHYLFSKWPFRSLQKLHPNRVVPNYVRDNEIKLYRCTSLCRFTHRRCMRSLFSISSRPNHWHENLLPVREKSAISNLWNRFLRCHFLSRLFVNECFATLRWIILQYASSPSLCKHSDDAYSYTRRAPIGTFTLKRVFTIFNAQTIKLLVLNEIIVELRRCSGDSSREHLRPRHTHLCKVTQPDAKTLNVSYRNTKTAACSILYNTSRTTACSHF